MSGASGPPPRRRVARRAGRAPMASRRAALPARADRLRRLLASGSSDAGHGSTRHPAAVADRCGPWSTERALLWLAGVATYYEALGGLLIGTVAGSLVAFATARWATARDILLPVAIGASAIPLDRRRAHPHQLVRGAEPALQDDDGRPAGVLPHRSSTSPAAWSQVQPAALELMRSYAATPTEVLRKVRDPEHAAVLLHGAQGGHHPGVHRRHRGRVLRRHLGVLGKVVMTSMATAASTWPGRASSSAPAARSSPTSSCRSSSAGPSRGTRRSRVRTGPDSRAAPVPAPSGRVRVGALSCAIVARSAHASRRRSRPRRRPDE